MSQTASKSRFWSLLSLRPHPVFAAGLGVEGERGETPLLHGKLCLKYSDYFNLTGKSLAIKFCQRLLGDF